MNGRVYRLLSQMHFLLNTVIRAQMSKISTIMLFTDELPYSIQYVCPCCDQGNYVILPENVTELACAGCGVILDGSDAQIEIPHVDGLIRRTFKDSID